MMRIPPSISSPVSTWPLLDDVLVVDDQQVAALLVVAERDVGHQQRLDVLLLGDAHAHEQARLQHRRPCSRARRGRPACRCWNRSRARRSRACRCADSPVSVCSPISTGIGPRSLSVTPALRMRSRIDSTCCSSTLNFT